MLHHSIYRLQTHPSLQRGASRFSNDSFLTQVPRSLGEKRGLPTWPQQRTMPSESLPQTSETILPRVSVPLYIWPVRQLRLP